MDVATEELAGCLRSWRSRLHPAEAGMVGELRAAAVRYPADAHLHSLIEDLRTRSPRLAELWTQRPRARAHPRRKTFSHPELG
jgi:hypothetical protein